MKEVFWLREFKYIYACKSIQVCHELDSLKNWYIAVCLLFFLDHSNVSDSSLSRICRWVCFCTLFRNRMSKRN